MRSIILVVSSLMLRVAFPAAAVGVALWAHANGFGLFNLIETSPVVAGIACFIILDFLVWLEHVMSHKWQWLWRIHRVHHSDTGFDVTTALRFHPLEIIVSLFWKGTVVALLGAPALAVLIFEDKEKMSTEFYIGAVIILLTVILNGIIKSRIKAT